MNQSTPGKDFEAYVIGALRRACACNVFTSETLDLHHKIDGEIRRIGSTRLEKPVQVQLTLRIDHFGKLRAYLATRWLNTDIISLYVEVHNGPGIRETAEHIVWAAQETQHLTPYGRLPIFGLRVDDDAAFFDPYERLRELGKELKSPERLAALKSGTVYRFVENGFWIMDDAGRTYFAHYIDAFDDAFRRRLRNAEPQLPVHFLPVGPARATDIRFIHPAQHRALRR